MYSDNDFEDAGYDAPLASHEHRHDQHQNYEFDINTAFSLTGEAYDLDSSALLQTVGRGSSPMYSFGLQASLAGGIGGGSEAHQPAFAVDEDGEELAVGNANLGSPQPSTIKKLKSHLDGVGMGGGYLTSPMGMMRKGGAVATGYSVQMNQVGASGEGTLNTSPAKSSPLKPLQHPPQQDQQVLQAYQQRQHSVFQPLQPLQPYQQRRHEPQQQTQRQLQHQPYQQQSSQMQQSYSQPSYQQQVQQQQQHTQAVSLQDPQQPQSQQQWCYNSAPLAPSITSTAMSRMQSAPAAISLPPMPAPAPAVQPANEAPSAAARPATAAAATAAAATTKRKAASRKASSSKLQQPTSSNIGLGIPGAAFSELDYGCMRIYGRPLARSASPGADPANAPLPGNGGAAFLPYPEHLPTVTLGRGLKHVHDVDAPVSHLSFPPVPVPSRDEEAQLASTCPPGVNNSDEEDDEEEEEEEELPATAAAPISAKAPVMKQSNLNKPFIQYVPPNSPAAKAAAARNRNKLSINTAAGGSGDSSKLVPIRMSPSKRDMPLTLPITATSTMSSRSPHRLASPAKAAAASAATGHGGYSTTGLAPPPAFEFSLEDYENYSAQVTNGNHHDFAAALGLPRTPGLESCSSAGSVSSSSGAGGARNGGRGEYLSPGPLSTTSTYSSVFSSVTDEMASLFAGPNSPSFFEPGEPSSVDQALATLLERNALYSARFGQHPMQLQQDLAYQEQMNINALLSAQPPRLYAPPGHSFVSPPHSPSFQGGASNAPSPSHQHAQSTWWAPPSNETESAGISQRTDGSNIDPALRQISQSSVGNHALLSPHSQQTASFYGSPQQQSHPSHNPQYGELSQSGRPISSPRRLQGMRSAPDLGALYQQQQQSTSPNFAELLHSPTPRKASLKRGRNAYASEYEDEEDEEDYGGDENGNGQYQQGVYLGHQPPAKKRSISVGLNTLAQSPNPSLSGASPGRLRPGPKPKTSLPNLQAARQSVFVVAANAPPVPHLPMTYGSGMASGSVSSHSQSALSPSPDPEAASLAALQLQQAGLSKDTLASFYSISTGDRQTKKGRPQRVYICAIPGCLKEFPRKSAVESHIQTHLEDKPFACPYDDCGASFVRSHDLTRHVRIHSGSKPFECACGKGFARGDALTRHRQRGICEGSLVPRRW